MIWRLGLTLVIGYALATGPAGAASPGLTLNPGKGPPNSVVTFDGSGFCGTCGPVSVTFNNFPVAAVPVSGSGTFHGTFEVPATPAGQQRVVATQPDGNASATALFFVGPSLPGPTGPQPTVSFVPPAGPTPLVSTVPQPGPSTSGPTPGPGEPSGTSSSGSAQDQADQSGPGWWVWLLIGIAAAVAGAGTALVYRKRRAGSQ